MAPLTTAVSAVGLTAATIGLSWQGVKANVLAMPLLPCQPAESRLGGRKLHGGLGRTITRALALLTYEFEAAAVTRTLICRVGRPQLIAAPPGSPARAGLCSSPCSGFLTCGFTALGISP
jgi:hypothetical protein